MGCYLLFVHVWYSSGRPRGIGSPHPAARFGDGELPAQFPTDEAGLEGPNLAAPLALDDTFRDSIFINRTKDYESGV